MSLRIQGIAGQCPCIRCQKSLFLTPAQRAVKKLRKLGATLPKWAKEEK